MAIFTVSFSTSSSAGVTSKRDELVLVSVTASIEIRNTNPVMRYETEALAASSFRSVGAAGELASGRYRR